MNKTKLKKYIGKKVTVHFSYKLYPQSGRIIYHPNESLCDYSHQARNFSGSMLYHVPSNPRVIGHIIEKQK